MVFAKSKFRFQKLMLSVKLSTSYCRFYVQDFGGKKTIHGTMNSPKSKQHTMENV